MVNRNHMDDIRYRLEVAKKELCRGDLEDGKLLELLQDCQDLRREDPSGPHAETLEFIESMLSLVRSNIANVESLRHLTKRAQSPGTQSPGTQSPPGE